MKEVPTILKYMIETLNYTEKFFIFISFNLFLLQ